MSAGVPDTDAGRAYANSIARRIESDLENDYYYGGGNYDPTRIKYRPKTFGKNRTDITTAELFEKFTKHQQKAEGLAQSSITARYEPITKALKKQLNILAASVGKSQAGRFADYCDDTLTPTTAKAIIWLLKSAWDWAAESGQYPLGEGGNPWGGLARRWRKIEPVKSPPAFTKDEVSR